VPARNELLECGPRSAVKEACIWIRLCQQDEPDEQDLRIQCRRRLITQPMLAQSDID